MTREEAINEIKSWDFLEGKEIEAIQTLIPELRESEDERIRESILHKMKACQKQSNFFSEEEIAYLEKQKECVVDSSKTSADEDERIREFLVDYFTSYKIGNVATKLNGVRIDDILNYLKKQKESLHISETCKENANSFTDGVIEVRSFQRGMEEGRKLETQKEPGIKWLKSDNVKNPDKPYVDKAGMFYTTDGRMCYASEIEQQKEQKHPNGCFTCDEYKKGYEEGRRNGFTAGYNKAMKEVEQKEQKPVVTLGETYHVDTLGTQQVIAGKMPQKPEEWNEWDEKMLQSIIKDFRAGKVSTIGQEQWLKSLRPQSKQKQNDYITPHKEFFKFIYDRLINVHKENPNVDYMRSFKERLNNLSFGEKQEWSEEDERKLQHCIDIVGVWEGDYDIAYAPYSNFLKSLRPSWKPSEEQMKALYCAIEDVAKFSKRGGRQVELENESYYSALHSLYCNLEKLM